VHLVGFIIRIINTGYSALLLDACPFSLTVQYRFKLDLLLGGCAMFLRNDITEFNNKT
jgi:hypothetical protein